MLCFGYPIPEIDCIIHIHPIIMSVFSYIGSWKSEETVHSGSFEIVVGNEWLVVDLFKRFSNLLA